MHRHRPPLAYEDQTIWKHFDELSLPQPHLSHLLSVLSIVNVQLIANRFTTNATYDYFLLISAAAVRLCAIFFLLCSAHINYSLYSSTKWEENKAETKRCIEILFSSSSWNDSLDVHWLKTVLIAFHLISHNFLTHERIRMIRLLI